MVMEYLKKRAEISTKDNACSPPDWTSKKNASFKAWEYVEKEKILKEIYIKSHKKITDFLTKQKYQIKGSDVAKALNISRASLMNTSSYSSHFRKYLCDVNSQLEDAKNAVFQRARQAPARGSIRNRKDELIAANTALRKKVTELESQKAKELVKYAFDQLPLPVKNKLGINK